MLKAADLAYVRMQVPDLDAAERFFHAFGLTTRAKADDRRYFCGTGTEHHLLIAQRGDRRLLAIGYAVGSMAELEAASHMPGASAVQPRDEPGGGQMVTLPDPDGNQLECVWGIAPGTSQPLPPRVLNAAGERERRRNAVIRLTREAAHVLRIGHVVLRTPDVERLSNWYKTTLGMLASDNVPAPDGPGLLMSFLRLDQGAQAVDHHVFQALIGPPNLLHHVSFEVQDIDDLHLGHSWLRKSGYAHVWGIGRHLQGSQIFDYWLDPFGVMYEHWTDTDMFDASVPVQIIQPDQIDTPWGPTIPAAFMEQGTR